MKNLILAWVLARLREKSTWAGILGAIGSATGHALAPDQADAIDQVCLAVVGAVCVFTQAHKPAPVVNPADEPPH